jgi:hypothetical protein
VNLAKSQIGPKKLLQSSRTDAVKWQFLVEISPPGKLDQYDTQEQSMLFDSNSGIELPPRQTEYLMGSTVNNLLKL